jgi:small ligand-binding sensory domain FIST
MKDIETEPACRATLAKEATFTRFSEPSRSGMREWMHLLAVAVAAALLTGLLALPFTMPGQAFAGILSATGSAAT